MNFAKQFKWIVTLIFQFLLIKSYSQDNFIRITCIGQTNKPIELEIFKDSLILWAFELDEDSISYSTQYGYDTCGRLIFLKNYRNRIFINEYLIKKDGQNNLIPIRINRNLDNSNNKNTICLKDSAGRLVELKTYHIEKKRLCKKKTVIDSWYKYYYLINVDFTKVLESLSNR